MADNEQRFCPDCGSEDVEPDFRRTNVLGEMMFNANKWICNECGYAGLMPSGEASETEDLEFDEGSEHELVDGSAGKAYSIYFVYLFVPATVLFVLYIFLV